MNAPLLLAVVALGIAAPAAAADSHREQFKKLVAQVAEKPYDVPLRESVIQLSAKIKPSPEIPEEARRSFIIGEGLFKSAKKLRPAFEAANAFKTATTLAPWWKDAYWNLAVAQQLIGRYDGAKDSLKLYIAATTSAKEKRAALDRTYAVEAEQLAAKAAVPEGLAGFWQKTAHFYKGDWKHNHPEDVRSDTYEIISTGSSYEMKELRKPVEVKVEVIRADAGGIYFVDRYTSPEYRRATNFQCRRQGNTMDCDLSYSEDGKTESARYRFDKRATCEVVGEEGIMGLPVLCK